MPTIIDNKNAFEYNKAINTNIKSICQPFMSSLGASLIAYHRIYFNDGQSVSVATDHEILKDYFDYVKDKGLFFQEYIKKIPENKFHYFLWPNKVENKLQGIIHQIGIWNGFNIYLKQKDYVENFVFAGKLDNNEMQNNCINNIEFANSFVGYFKNKASEFIYNVNKEKMAYFNCQNLSFYEPDKNFSFSSLKTKSVPFFLNDQKIELTSREALVLSFTNFGHSDKEIASILGISNRTVEAHLANIKSKSKLHYRSEFFDIIKLPENAMIKNLKNLYINEIGENHEKQKK